MARWPERRLRCSEPPVGREPPGTTGWPDTATRKEDTTMSGRSTVTVGSLVLALAITLGR
jgi:hypothetical protein